ncbi:hypothetical protein ACSBL2_25315 [Pedobacter sp. AW31-3R]|uniref:hypothetical protein n=1 Tax=Pedobacter sp. AW31-3R TaxID=3445781 RepID=UPI003FA0B250
MYKKINYITAVLVLLISISVNAQITTQSPYSRFGLGNLTGSQLPQFRAMGGVSTAVNKPVNFNLQSNINVQNPASYAGINLTTIDVGISVGATTLKMGSEKDNSFNGALSHVAFAFPVTPHSAFSFGLIPYSQVGYNYSSKGTVSSGSNPSVGNATYTNTGEGGLNKAYLGYGFQLWDHLRLGANVEYLFGNIIENRDVDYRDDGYFLAARLQNKNSIGGLAYSYGVQYDIRLDSKTSLNFGYSGSSSSSINSTKTYLATKYITDAVGDDGGALETIDSVGGAKQKLKLPLIHNFGIALQKDNKWLIGADFRTGKWSGLTLNSQSMGLQDTYGASLGGQITPDFTSINNYFKRVDYRLGVNYDKTYIQQGGEDIKQMGIAFGVGLPLASSPTRTAYRLNLTAEVGKRGTTNNGLLQENYMNFHVSFMINDRWFRQFKFD